MDSALGYTCPVARQEGCTRPPGHTPRLQSRHLWVLPGLVIGLDQPGAQVPGTSPEGPWQSEGCRTELPVGPNSPPASAGRDPGGSPAPAEGLLGLPLQPAPHLAPGCGETRVKSHGVQRPTAQGARVFPGATPLAWSCLQALGPGSARAGANPLLGHGTEPPTITTASTDQTRPQGSPKLSPQYRPPRALHLGGLCRGGTCILSHRDANASLE